MSDIALEFDGVWKKFRRGEQHDSLRDLIPALLRKPFSGSEHSDLKKIEFWALSDVSFQVKRGEALGIIGPNGSGKSTSLKILSSILRPTRGQMKVNGRLSALIEVGAGFHQDLTGRENIYLNGAILGMKKHEIDKRLDEIIDFSGISDFIDTPVKRFSSGMYARLGFSIAAHVDPEILLVDEVLSVGDMWFQEKCLNKMLSFSKNNTSIIFVSHNLESVNILCTKTAFLKKGSLVSVGKTSDIIKEYICSHVTDSVEKDDENAISEVRLTDDKGAFVDIFKPEGKARLTFNFKCSKPFSDCQLGFVINRLSDNLSVCDYNLPLEVLTVNSASDTAKGTVDFDINLLRGAYSITLHLYHYSSATFLAYAKNVAFFSVEERISFNGISHIRPCLHQ